MLYLYNVRGAHGSSDQRGLRNGADVQIGGGVRVGDAFQAIVGPRPVAIRVTENCVQISQARPITPRRYKQERTDKGRQA